MLTGAFAIHAKLSVGKRGEKINPPVAEIRQADMLFHGSGRSNGERNWGRTRRWEATLDARIEVLSG